MLNAERRTYILNALQNHGKVMARSLSEALGASEDTIRRDLRELAAEGLLQRVHGGALPASPSAASFATRREHDSLAKRAIARAAARLIQPGQVVLLDGGTTNVQVAELLPADLEATIVTNSPPLAAALGDHPRVEVIVLGGRLDKHAMVTHGEATIEALSMVRPDLYLLGVCSLHPEVGVSTLTLEEAYLKSVMIAASAETVALAAAEKLNTAAPYVVGPLTKLSEIITGGDVADEALEPYRALGVTVTRA